MRSIKREALSVYGYSVKMKLSAKQIIILFLIALIVIAPAGSEDLFRHNYASPDDGLELMPLRDETLSVREFYNGNKPAYSVEMLYEFPGGGEINWRELYFKLRSISRLEELSYYSEYAGKYRNMFPRAYVMRSARDKTRIPDYSDDTVFGDAEIYAFLDEVELKDGRYRINYSVHPDSIQIRIRNISNLRRFLKVVGKEDFYMDFLFFEENRRLMVYVYGAFTLKNEFIVLKLVKYPSSTLAKRVYMVFSSLIDGFHGAVLPVEFPDYLRE